MTTFEGRCTCGEAAFRLTRAPLCVHCCHCSWCRRETGSAFALNALIEAAAVETLRGAPETVLTPSASGAGQRIERCRTCRTALWSVYSGAGPRFRFVRVGTLDRADLLAPDVHIFAASKLPWVVLPEGARVFPEYYDRQEVWTTEALARREAALR